MEILTQFSKCPFWMTNFRVCLLRTQTPKLTTHHGWFRIFGVFHFWGPNFEIQDFSSVFWGTVSHHAFFTAPQSNNLLRPFKGWKKPYSPGWKRRSGGNFVDWSRLWGRWIFLETPTADVSHQQKCFEFHSWWICAKFAFFFLRGGGGSWKGFGKKWNDEEKLARINSPWTNRSRLSIYHPCAWRLLDQGMPQSVVYGCR